MQTQTNQQLKAILQSYAALVKQALLKGLFTDTNQVIICHNDLAALKKIVDESEQQTGKNSMDSGNGAPAVRKNRKVIQKEKTETAKDPGTETGSAAAVKQLEIPA